jgi:hypothetical protein
MQRRRRGQSLDHFTYFIILIDRVKDLQDKLIQRIRPFVDAKNPGDQHDQETKVFEGRIRTEAEDLKLESFGVEVSC